METEKYLSPYENSRDDSNSFKKVDKRKRSDSWSKLSLQKKRRNTIIRMHNEVMIEENKEAPMIRLKNMGPSDGELSDVEDSSIKKTELNAIEEDDDFFFAQKSSKKVSR